MRDADSLARDVVAKLHAADAFSRWLGIQVVEAAHSKSVVTMTVRDEMVNGFGSAHGGVVFSLADTALQFIVNSGGFLSVALDCTISYPVAVRPGDVLTAQGIEESTTNKLAFCAITVRNQHDIIVAHFRGTAYRTARMHFPESGSTQLTAERLSTSDESPTHAK